MAALVAPLLVLVAIALGLFWRHPTRGEAIDSLAVLPFWNASGDRIPDSAISFGVWDCHRHEGHCNGTYGDRSARRGFGRTLVPG